MVRDNYHYFTDRGSQQCC